MVDPKSFILCIHLLIAVPVPRLQFPSKVPKDSVSRQIYYAVIFSFLPLISLNLHHGGRSASTLQAHSDLCFAPEVCPCVSPFPVGLLYCRICDR